MKVYEKLLIQAGGGIKLPIPTIDENLSINVMTYLATGIFEKNYSIFQNTPNQMDVERLAVHVFAPSNNIDITKIYDSLFRVVSGNVFGTYAQYTKDWRFVRDNGDSEMLIHYTSQTANRLYQIQTNCKGMASPGNQNSLVDRAMNYLDSIMRDINHGPIFAYRMISASQPHNLLNIIHSLIEENRSRWDMEKAQESLRIHFYEVAKDAFFNRCKKNISILNNNRRRFEDYEYYLMLLESHKVALESYSQIEDLLISFISQLVECGDNYYRKLIHVLNTLFDSFHFNEFDLGIDARLLLDGTINTIDCSKILAELLDCFISNPDIWKKDDEENIFSFVADFFANSIIDNLSTNTINSIIENISFFTHQKMSIDYPSILQERQFKLANKFPYTVRAKLAFHTTYDGICVTAGTLIGSGFQPQSMNGITIPQEIDGITVTELNGNYNYSEFGYIEAFELKRISLNISGSGVIRCMFPWLCGGVQDTLKSIQLSFSAHEMHLDAFTNSDARDKLTHVSFHGRVTADPDWDESSFSANLFRNCSKLYSVVGTFEGGYLGAGCFDGCSSLTVIPTLKIKYMGDRTFFNCKSLKTIPLYNGLKSIGSCSFANCISLESMYIPDSVEWIGSNLFEACENLMSVHLSNNIDEISDATFLNCKRLIKVWLPEKLKKINSNAFNNCENLQNLYLPDSLTFIGNYSFYGCRSLKELQVPKSVISIGKDAFEDCQSLLLKVEPDSYAEEYAKKHAISFIYI